MRRFLNVWRSVSTQAGSSCLDNFAGQGNDLHEFTFAKFAANSTKDPCSAGALVFVDQNDGVAIEFDVAAIGTSYRSLGANDDRSNDRLLLDVTTGNDILDTASLLIVCELPSHVLSRIPFEEMSHDIPHTSNFVY